MLQIILIEKIYTIKLRRKQRMTTNENRYQYDIFIIQIAMQP